MIPKVLTALLSAAILSAVLGALPCQANGAKHHVVAKRAPVATRATGASDLNSPATNFSGVEPVTEVQDPNLLPPKKDKYQFFN